MRRLDHLNIVQLKYFFFSSGDKVRPVSDERKLTVDLFLLLVADERRSLLKSRPGVYTGNGLSRGTSLHQAKANHSAPLRQSK